MPSKIYSAMAAGRAGNVAALVRPNLPLTSVDLRELTTSTVVDATRLYEILPELQWPTFAEALRPVAEGSRGIAQRKT